MGNKDSKPSTSSLEKHEISSGSSSGSDGSDRRRDENYKHNSCVMSIRNVSAYPILCVGDSLTAGYSHYGSLFTPYGETIESMSRGAIEIDVIGMSGWTTEHFLNTLDKDCIVDVCRRKSCGIRKQLQHRSYKLVMLMIGTNDIGTGVEVNEVFENICKLRDVILQYVPKMVLFTVPSSRNYQPIHELNDKIKSLVSQNSGDTYLFDCHAFFHHANELAHQSSPTESLSDPQSSSSLTENKHENVFDFDRLHFTEYGSKILGEKLYSKLEDFGVILENSPIPQNP